VKLNSKFDIGEEVFFPVHTGVVTSIIEVIQATVTRHEVNGEVRVSISYDTNNQKDGTHHKSMPEESLFKTKKAAARYVLNSMGFYVSQEDLKDIKEDNE